MPTLVYTELPLSHFAWQWATYWCQRSKQYAQVLHGCRKIRRKRGTIIFHAEAVTQVMALAHLDLQQQSRVAAGFHGRLQ